MLGELDTSVKASPSFLCDHIGRQESITLSATQRHLTVRVWAILNAAFKLNRNPDFDGDTDKEYRHLYSLIGNAANDCLKRGLPSTARQ